jgi:hypothetical protein
MLLIRFSDKMKLVWVNYTYEGGNIMMGTMIYKPSYMPRISVSTTIITGQGQRQGSITNAPPHW